MKMKIQQSVLLFAIVSLLNISCKNENNPTTSEGDLKNTEKFSSEVAVKWINVQLDMLRVPLATGTGTQAAERAQAYCGIALYEAVVKGMPKYRSLEGQLTNFPILPSIENDKVYHWAASANAALAFMNRQLFSTASVINKAAMDALENSLQAQYAAEVDDATLQRSIFFGKLVAASITYWAAGDGSEIVNPAYIPPSGPGLWVPTAPTPPVNAYAGQRRLLVPDVAGGMEPSPPPAYSTDPASIFYSIVKDVYDKSRELTPDQKAMAIYHRDAPDYPDDGHFVAVLSQVLSKAGADLERAAEAFVKTGIGLHDAVVICFNKKYIVNLVRPITYIRDVMGYTTWNPLIPTPNHPEFPPAHAVNSATVAWMLTSVFSDQFSFKLDTYNYQGLPARYYSSFKAMSIEMSNAGVFEGIQYQASCDKGIWLGEKIGQNILSKVKFLK